jgi:hypothetical protein
MIDETKVSLKHDLNENDSIQLNKTIGENGVEVVLDHKFDENANLVLDNKPDKTSLTLNIKI